MGESALAAGTLVGQEGGALGFALQARSAAPQSASALAFYTRVTQAIQVRANELATANDVHAAAALLDQAKSQDPSCEILNSLRGELEQMIRSAAAQPRAMRVGHLHGLNLSLDPNAKIGFGKNMCVGSLEILQDGFAFQTEQSQDKRRESLHLTLAEIRKVDLRKEGRQLSLLTSQGKLDFVGEPADLNEVARHLSANLQ